MEQPRITNWILPQLQTLLTFQSDFLWNVNSFRQLDTEVSVPLDALCKETERDRFSGTARIAEQAVKPLAMTHHNLETICDSTS